MKTKKAVVAVLLGDASGVGPEIIVKAFSDHSPLSDKVSVVLLGDVRILHRAEETVNRKLDIVQISPDETRNDFTSLAMIDTGRISPEEAPMSVVSANCGRAVMEDIHDAIRLYAEGRIDGICFGPFNKQAMRLNEPGIASELELFTRYCGEFGLPVEKELGEINVVDGLWTTRVTSHVPLTEIGHYLTKEKILDMIRLADKNCRAAGIENPRILVAALNPHCGEGGLCGTEEQTMILPAMEEAKKEGINIIGMYSADTVFVHAFNNEADAVVTMYHDQGQIALKLRNFRHAVTVSAGLPMPITTPAHGTAHDIAGTGTVDPTAFLTAFEIAANQSINSINDGV